MYTDLILQYLESESAQQTQNICITFIQCWTNVEDVGPTLYKCYTNVLSLLGDSYSDRVYMRWKMCRYKHDIIQKRCFLILQCKFFET